MLVSYTRAAGSGTVDQPGRRPQRCTALLPVPVCPLLSLCLPQSHQEQRPHRHCCPYPPDSHQKQQPNRQSMHCPCVRCWLFCPCVRQTCTYNNNPIVTTVHVSTTVPAVWYPPDSHQQQRFHGRYCPCTCYCSCCPCACQARHQQQRRQ